MVARHFMNEDELISLLANQPEQSEESVRAMLLQVKEKNYNPPKRDRIMEWQAQQEFPICPNIDDPSGCNVYSELKFPDEIYEQIGEFWQEKAENTDAA